MTEKSKCKYPEHLKTVPEECSPEQIEKCHGKESEHSCAETKCQYPEHLVEKPEKCSHEQIKKCHGDDPEHPCTKK